MRFSVQREKWVASAEQAQVSVEEGRDRLTSMASELRARAGDKAADAVRTGTGAATGAATGTGADTRCTGVGAGLAAYHRRAAVLRTPELVLTLVALAWALA